MTGTEPLVGIVTGAGRGMGLSCAQRLVDRVDRLLVVDIDEATLTQAAMDLASPRAVVEAVVLDVTDRDGLADLAARIGTLGRLGPVAHAAGISPTMSDWRRIFTVDLVGTALLTEALLPLATETTAVVCFASMAGQIGASIATAGIDAVLDDPLAEDFLDRLHEAAGPGIEDTGTAYMHAKRGVQRLVRREALRFGPAGARICSISPGIIDTPMGRQEAAAMEAMKTLTEMSALRREGRPEELAAVVAFLLSDEASFITGTDVLVDGGVCAAVQTG
ncbi:MAG TPA: SDR family oxidoreductase [Mycobacteriales bacterium]|nr:SDR family oxidoreductase [Mycobacteriales bacterium]